MYRIEPDYILQAFQLSDYQSPMSYLLKSAECQSLLHH